jgi:hypothetical protein
MNLQKIIQMKKLLTFLFSLMIMGSLFSQENKSDIKPDPRLIDALGQETVYFYAQNNPKLILYYNFFLNHSYQITEIPQEKVKDLKDIPEFQLKPQFQMESPDYTEKGLENLNIMKYDFKIETNVGPIYRLGNTNKLIIFLSGKEIQTNFNQSVK